MQTEPDPHACENVDVHVCPAGQPLPPLDPSEHENAFEQSRPPDVLPLELLELLELLEPSFAPHAMSAGSAVRSALRSDAFARIVIARRRITQGSHIDRPKA
jgi:hypothetical protein